MQRVGIVLIVLGAVFALLAGFTLFVLFPRQPQALPEPTTSVIVAFQGIDARTELSADRLGKMDWPARVPTPIGAFQNTDQVAGKLALVPINPGQPIIDKMLIDKPEFKEMHSNASLILDKGTLAIALPVSPDANVAESVQVGDRVDIIATFTIQPITNTQSVQPVGPPIIVTQRILQDVLVLQVGTWPRPVSQGQTGPATQATGIVTLQVTEQEALVVKYVQGQAGYFSLALRPANDHALANPTPVTIDYLIDHFGLVRPTPIR